MLFSPLATNTPETGSSNVAVIAGGIVAAIIALLIIITVIMVILVVKRHTGTFSLKNQPNRYIYTVRLAMMCINTCLESYL